MTTPLDIKLVPKISELIDKHGISAIYRVVSQPNGTYSPSSQDLDNASITPNENDTTVISTPVFGYKISEISESIDIKRDGYIFIKDYTGFTPKTGDRFIIAGYTWAVVRAQPHSTGTLIAAWEIQLRKGANSAD